MPAFAAEYGPNPGNERTARPDAAFTIAGALPFASSGERGPAREPGRAQVAGDDLVPVFGPDVGERNPLAGEAGEVHQSVERLPPARDLGERGRDRLFVGGVDRNREHRARRRVPLDRRRQIQYRDVEAVGERRDDERATDAAATAGHHEPRAGRRAEAAGGRGG